MYAAVAGLIVASTCIDTTVWAVSINGKSRNEARYILIRFTKRENCRLCAEYFSTFFQISLCNLTKSGGYCNFFSACRKPAVCAGYCAGRVRRPQVHNILSWCSFFSVSFHAAVHAIFCKTGILVYHETNGSAFGTGLQAEVLIVCYNAVSIF